MGPDSKVIGPAIVNSWSSAGTELTSTIAVLQTGTVFIAVVVLLAVMRRLSHKKADDIYLNL
jgi:hypothetical protein